MVHQPTTQCNNQMKNKRYVTSISDSLPKYNAMITSPMMMAHSLQKAEHDHGGEAD